MFRSILQWLAGLVVGTTPSTVLTTLTPLIRSKLKLGRSIREQPTKKPDFHFTAGCRSSDSVFFALAFRPRFESRLHGQISEMKFLSEHQPNNPNKLLLCRQPVPILRALFERNSDLCDVQKVLKRRSPWPSDSKSPPAEKSCAPAPGNAIWRNTKTPNAGGVSVAPPRCIPRTCTASRRTSRSATNSPRPQTPNARP